jgi:hypothetical protein
MYLYRAEQMVVATAQDYEAALTDVKALRKLTDVFVNCFAPVKKFWSDRLDEARKDEQKYTGKVAQAKKLIEEKALAWKRDDDRRQREERARQEAEERRRAEEMRLAQAAALEARGNELQNEGLKAAAVRMLDEPLDIAPTQLAKSTPKVSGVKTVERRQACGAFAWSLLGSKLRANEPLTDADWDAAKVIKGQDLENLIICMAATFLCEREIPAEVRAFLKPLASRCVTPGMVEVKSQAILQAEKQYGAAFHLGGITIQKREGLG